MIIVSRQKGHECGRTQLTFTLGHVRNDPCVRGGCDCLPPAIPECFIGAGLPTGLPLAYRLHTPGTTVTWVDPSDPRRPRQQPTRLGGLLRSSAKVPASCAAARSRRIAVLGGARTAAAGPSAAITSFSRRETPAAWPAQALHATMP
jgi:hypothetical protein